TENYTVHSARVYRANANKVNDKKLWKQSKPDNSDTTESYTSPHIAVLASAKGPNAVVQLFGTGKLIVDNLSWKRNIKGSTYYYYVTEVLYSSIDAVTGRTTISGKSTWCQIDTSALAPS